MRVLFIAYIDHSGMASGSEVRTAKMLQAFREEGHELIELTGWQTDADRVAKIRGVLRTIRENKPDLCYIESPTYPIMRHADRRLIRTVHRMGVPIGYFYRDFNSKFPEEFPKRTDLPGRCKDLALALLQRLTDRCLRACDIIYLPSADAAPLFPFRDIRELPPAGEDRLGERKSASKVGIYVGGVIGHYDGALLLDAFSELSRRDPAYELLLVCREEEWEKLSHPCKGEKWLHVYHCAGEDLRPLYERAGFGLIVCSHAYRYNDLAVSVKLFEYLSYGLPQITINGRAMARLIEENGIGLVAEPTAEAFAAAIERLCGDGALYASLQENSRRALTERHLWAHRVRQVVRELTEKKNGGGSA